ncbi:MAG: hypothetical protein V7K76_09335 [Nostoc sp.]|uniref:hypothetical protein n=1 Tax=Nostoc sp. TaxID=1180 RepID=UPI002FF91C0A
MKNYNLESPELHLNLQRCRIPFVSDLTTTQVSDIIKLLAKQDILAKDVLRLAKEDNLKVPYIYGTLVFTISDTHKPGNRYRLSAEMIPNSYTSA